MSSDNSPNASAPPAQAAGRGDGIEPNAGNNVEPYEAWIAALDAWWRQTPAPSKDLRRAVQTALDQALALSRIARGEAPGAGDDGGTRTASTPRGPSDFGIWQPLMAALEQCQAKLLPESVGADAAPGYAKAAAAYFAEFERINAELLPRLTRSLGQRDATGFVQMHRAALEEAERVYLKRAFSDEFAERQARFINEMLRLAKQLQDARAGAKQNSRE